MTDPLLDQVVVAVGDHYELEQELGRGGMSVVYRARDRRLGRPVAIKVLPPQLALDPAVRTRFAREAHTSAQLAHPHIVPIHDVGEHEGIAWLVMALVSGGSLAGLLAREPRLSVEEVRRLVREIADALDYAHQRGVIHRDIKPDNILLDGDSGRAVVTDFGIARAMEAGTRLTATGAAVGTPTYMSPEQAVGERQLDGRSDIYSLGVLAYQMLTGRVPFTANNPMALLMKHVAEPPRPIAELRPDVPLAMARAIERALAKSPDDRWPTAGALRDALRSDAGEPSWRAEQRPPVRYLSPRPASVRPSAAGEGPGVAPAAEEIVLEPAHYAGLTPEQREDLRLWHGRVNLFDRVKAMRGYALSTAAMTVLGLAGFGAGVSTAPPLVLAPIVPAYMAVKLWKRGKSLRAAGLRLRRVLLMPLARWVIPAPPPPPTDAQLAKLAPRELLEGPHGAVIRRAAEDRAAILDLVGRMTKADRGLLPDIVPTVHALLERVVHLAQALGRIEQDIDPRLGRDLDQRIAAAADGESPEGQRRLSLLKRQRATLEDLQKRRDELARQLDNAHLALGNLRLDLVRLRSSGIQATLADVSTATQEARALSRDIGLLLDAAAEVKGL